MELRIENWVLNYGKDRAVLRIKKTQFDYWKNFCNIMKYIFEVFQLHSLIDL